MKINSRENNPVFTAKPSDMKAYTQTVRKGMQVLDKRLGIIIHNSSTPASPIENTGIGSLISTHAQAAFIPFLRSQAVTTIQQEPDYLRSIFDPSPYSPISTSKNIYSIPIDVLATDEYDNFLSKETLDKVVRPSSNDLTENVNYGEVLKNYNLALKEAYDIFSHRTRTFMSDKTLMLALEFSSFRKSHQEYIPNAIFESLSMKYHTDNWRTWDEKDKNLYDSKERTPYLKQLEEDLRFDIDFHLFKQWVLDRENTKAKKRNEELGIKVIADTPVAFSQAEEWQNKDLFMEKYSLGAPPDYFSKNGQRWEFPVLKPELIFNEDGSLGRGGEFLQKHYESIFKDAPGGARIDHVLGLIDPFVYSKYDPYMTDENSGRLYSSPHKPDFQHYQKRNTDEYAAILEKIVFPAAAKYGISKENIICEDLGHVTDAAHAVIDKLQLTGFSVTQFGCSGVDAPAKNVIMPGSHDNKSMIEYTNDLFTDLHRSQGGRDRFMYKTHVLASDTVTPDQDVNQYREELRNDKKSFLKASFTELFVSPAKRVQIFFTDFFGIGKTYNVPGTKEGCWTLRLGSNFEENYYDNLKKGLGVNLPEVIATAIRNKGEEFSSMHKTLLEKLDEFTKILKS